MKKLLTLILVLCSIVGFAQIRGGAQYDPGAARSNLSNVDATATPSMTSITLSGKVKAAWADILGDIYASGTVKVSTGTAAAPAYSFSSDPDTGIYSAGANQIGLAGTHLKFDSSALSLVANTSDGADTKALWICGGGEGSSMRGAGLDLYGNEHPTLAGRVLLQSGNVASGVILFNTAATNRMSITHAGNVLVNTLTDDGVNKLQVNGGVKISGSLKTALSGGTSTGYKIQDRAVGAATVATYTICTFQSLTGNEKFAYYGDILVCGLSGAEAYKVYVGGAVNAGNTALAMDVATVTATTLNGTPADIIASYSVVGVAGIITIHVPQTYHTMTMHNMWADTRLAPCVWAE